MGLDYSNNPTLRFKNFRENWKLHSLNEILTERKTRNSSGEFMEVFSVAKDKGVINQIDHLGRSYASEDITNYKVVHPFDIVYTKSPTANFPFGIIKQNRTERTGVVSVLYGVFKPQNEHLGLLLDYYFSSWVNTYNYLLPLVHKGAKNTMNIGNDDFLNGAKITLPSNLIEQKKITDFLSAITEKEKILSNKKTLLEKYKKGVLQAIFNQKIRFTGKNGKEYPKWETYKGKELFYSQSNKNHDGNLRILAATQENGVVPRDSIGIDIQSSDRSIKSYKIVEKGDFVISLRSFQGGIEYSEYYGICSPAYTILKPKTKIIDSFFKFYFKKEDFINRLSQTVVGIRDGKQISYDAFAGLKFKVPSLEEQTKIASFLTAIDDKIKQVSTQLEKTKEYKKGLLQQMFV